MTLDELRKRRIALLNWCLGEVLGTPRREKQKITLTEQRILDAREYLDPDTKKIIKFNLPVVGHYMDYSLGKMSTFETGFDQKMEFVMMNQEGE